MLIYRFVGGRDDGIIAVADREPAGQVQVRGRQLADERGQVVGRVIQDWETPPAAIAALLRRRDVPSSAVGTSRSRPKRTAPAVGASAPKPAAPTFSDEQEWRRHVKAWGIERGLVNKSARGRCTGKVLDAWRAEHGDPVYTS